MLVRLVRVNLIVRTSSDASEDRTISSLEDLSTDTAGPIKLVLVAGSLTIDGGADGQGVSAGGNGDVLLTAASDVTVNADVESATGNVTLDAGNDLAVNAAVTTGGFGTLYMVAANDLTVTGALTHCLGRYSFGSRIRSASGRRDHEHLW